MYMVELEAQVKSQAKDGKTLGSIDTQTEGQTQKYKVLYAVSN